MKIEHNEMFYYEFFANLTAKNKIPTTNNIGSASPTNTILSGLFSF
jgi:hypothetical protein